MQRGGIFFVICSVMFLSGILTLRADRIELTVGGTAISPGSELCYYSSLNVSVSVNDVQSCDVFVVAKEATKTSLTHLASFEGGEGSIEWTPSQEQRSTPADFHIAVRFARDGTEEEVVSSGFGVQWFNRELSQLEPFVETCPGQSLTWTPQLVGSNVTARWKRMGGSQYLSADESLQFEALRREDAGWYSCDVLSTCTDQEGALIYSYDVYLEVYIMPDVVRITPDKEIDEGDNIQLYCVIDEHSPTSLRWYHEDNPTEVLSTNKGLTIPQASVNDAGTYVFEATSDVCDWSYSTTVTIQVHAQPAIDDITITFPDCGALLTAHPNNVTFLQWYSKLEGSIVELEGETKSSLYVASLSSGEQFFCIGFNDRGASVESKHVEVVSEDWVAPPLMPAPSIVEVQLEAPIEQHRIATIDAGALDCASEFLLELKWDQHVLDLDCTTPGVHASFQEGGMSISGDIVSLNEVLSQISIIPLRSESTIIHSSLALVHHGGYLTQPQHLAVEVAVMAEQLEEPGPNLAEIPVSIHVESEHNGGMTITVDSDISQYKSGKVILYNYVGVELYSAEAQVGNPVFVAPEYVRSGGQFFVVYKTNNLQAVKRHVVQ